MDLRHLNSGRKSQYDVFWEECSKFLDEVVGTAVGDCCHSTVTHVTSDLHKRLMRSST